MKKLGILMALLLSLLMIVSLFTACDGEKKDENNDETTEAESIEDATSKEEESTLTGEDLLIGIWDAELSNQTDDISLILQFTFEKDGTYHSTVTKEEYDNFIEQTVDFIIKKPDFDYDAAIENLEELGYNAEGLEKRDIIKILVIAEYSDHKTFSSEFEFEGTWSLDGDNLLLGYENNGQRIIKTELSKGKTTFTTTYDISEELTFTKVD